MKQTLFVLLTLAVATLPGCRKGGNELVKVSYLHKYGVPVSERDWQAQGQEGQVVEVSKDGVTATKSYVNGILHGVTTYSFQHSSTIQKKERYENGHLVAYGEMYPSGMPAWEESYEGDGFKKRVCWYEQGTPHMVEQYAGELLVQGEYRSLLNEVISRVQEGEGLRLEHNNEGELVAQDRIEKGLCVEKATFYANGDPKCVTPYKNGVIEGIRLTFFMGAVPHTVEGWVNGMQEGDTFVYQNGEKLARIPYVKGKKQGVASLYRNGTELAEEVSWKADKMHGKRSIYIEEGITKVEWYLEGELVNKMTFDRLTPIN